MTKTVKAPAVLILMVWLMTILSFSASAKTGDRFRLYEEGNWIALGGINEFDDVKATSRSETQELENKLMQNNYILITSDSMSVLIEDYEDFMSGATFWFSSYMERKEPYWNVYKVYVYKPSYDDYMEQLRSESGVISRETVQELNNSTVVIDYNYWNVEDAIGTYSDKFNDNIPDYCETGYLKLISPIDCEVTILQAYTKQYYKFYVRKNVPFLVEIMAGCYHIVEVNSQNIPDNIDNNGEATLPYNNQLQIWSYHTKDSPYTIELYQLCSKYNIPDTDIDDKPDYSITGNNDKYIPEDTTVYIPSENTVVQVDNGNSQSNSKDNASLVLWIIIISIISLLIILVFIRIRKDIRDDGD